MARKSIKSVVEKQGTGMPQAILMANVRYGGSDIMDQHKNRTAFRVSERILRLQVTVSRGKQRALRTCARQNTTWVNTRQCPVHCTAGYVNSIFRSVTISRELWNVTDFARLHRSQEIRLVPLSEASCADPPAVKIFQNLLTVGLHSSKFNFNIIYFCVKSGCHFGFVCRNFTSL